MIKLISNQPLSEKEYDFVNNFYFLINEKKYQYVLLVQNFTFFYHCKNFYTSFFYKIYSKDKSILIKNHNNELIAVFSPKKIAKNLNFNMAINLEDHETITESNEYFNIYLFLNLNFHKHAFFLNPANTIICLNTRLSKNVYIENNVKIINSTIKKNSKILSNTTIENSTIQENVFIGQNCLIRNNSLLSKASVVGSYNEIKNVKLGSNSKIAHSCFIADTIIGENVNIGWGCVTANYDGKKTNNSEIKNNVFIGVQTSIISPVLIEDNVYIAANCLIKNNIDKNTYVKNNQELSLKDNKIK